MFSGIVYHGLAHVDVWQALPVDGFVRDGGLDSWVSSVAIVFPNHTLGYSRARLFAKLDETSLDFQLFGSQDVELALSLAIILQSIECLNQSREA